MNLSTPLSEENLQLVVEIFDATSKNLDVGYDLLSLLYDRLNGALFFIALNNHHHLNRMHGDQLNVKYIEHLFCGICNVSPQVPLIFCLFSFYIFSVT